MGKTNILPRSIWKLLKTMNMLKSVELDPPLLNRVCRLLSAVCRLPSEPAPLDSKNSKPNTLAVSVSSAKPRTEATNVICKTAARGRYQTVPPAWYGGFHADISKHHLEKIWSRLWRRIQISVNIASWLDRPWMWYARNHSNCVYVWVEKSLIGRNMFGIGPLISVSHLKGSHS